MKKQMYFLLFAIISSVHGMCAHAAELKIHDEWVAAAPPVAKSQAAYICFINDGDKDVRITGVSATGFGKAVLHHTMQHGDMTMMHAMDSLLIPAHKMVTLEPGSMHIMLMEPAKIALPGEKVTLTVEYSDNTKQAFDLVVKAAAEKSTKNHDHDQ